MSNHGLGHMGKGLKSCPRRFFGLAHRVLVAMGGGGSRCFMKMCHQEEARELCELPWCTQAASTRWGTSTEVQKAGGGGVRWFSAGYPPPPPCPSSKGVLS